MIKVMIADDQELIRESLKIVLGSRSDIQIVATAKDGLEVLDYMRLNPADVILMDIRMPNMDGVLATKEVKEIYPDTKIIVLTTFDDDEYVFSALKNGACGYLLKGISMDKLYDSIVEVYDGGAMINPDIAMKILQRFSNEGTNSSITVSNQASASLSTKEKMVAQQIGFGLSNKEIADKLHFSSGTVRNYISIILNKLELRDRTQVAIWAVQTNLINEDFSSET
ncbi:MAG: response regulator transcription factor [Erysipelotrichaceae bacterium]|nr:response regulator transcription factor [Erysipelotrichaceae bacterium]MDD3809696.1 response regulator transcription factor [Erysipelotrichaceae bacterium]